MLSDLTARVWQRLIARESLADLRLPLTEEGRIDLRGLVAPQPSIAREYQTAVADVKALANVIEIRGGNWKGIDFSDGRLKSLRFFDSKIEDCRFDRAVCQDWRIWGTAVSNTSFRSADLRRSALGGIDNGKRNSFRKIDFAYTDLRQTVHKSADFIDCTFCDTNLTKVDFWGSVFVNCSFEGDLNQVLFHRYAFRGEAFPPNEMKGVDFRRARFHFVEFRELDMDDVKWPEGDEHILLEDYRATLERALKVFRARPDTQSKAMAAIFEHKLKWAGPNQERGIVSKRDLIEVGGDEAVNEFLQLAGNE